MKLTSVSKAALILGREKFSHDFQIYCEKPLCCEKTNRARRNSGKSREKEKGTNAVEGTSRIPGKGKHKGTTDDHLNNNSNSGSLKVAAKLEDGSSRKPLGEEGRNEAISSVQTSLTLPPTSDLGEMQRRGPEIGRHELIWAKERSPAEIKLGKERGCLASRERAVLRGIK